MHFFFCRWVQRKVSVCVNSTRRLFLFVVEANVSEKFRKNNFKLIQLFSNRYGYKEKYLYVSRIQDIFSSLWGLMSLKNLGKGTSS
ncbi:hypothetical protein TNCT_443111 [Trichonephila clavata]|uniref:Uncharacterized protein n=1 Tax=Trichonephila clavata TaxID=2740835 RepID=A0A8X6I930_TRICU|nr:hypothetical protein TNCT_443111 [Trichonephila clavata]